MSLRVRASYAALLVAALCLCGAWPLTPAHLADASGNAGAVTVTAYGALEAPGDTASLAAEADPEDAESLAEARELQAIASYAGHLISTERSRSGLQDRPPRLARLG